MQWLGQRGRHDLADERWNLYGQLTYISSLKLPFRAAYTNLHGSNHSLSPDLEHGYTGTLTLFAGVALWPGAEAYWVPEMIAERPLSQLTGLGSAIQNFELQKTGAPYPVPYSSRLFLRQNIALGPARAARPSAAMVLGRQVAVRRLQLTVGNFSLLDLFDRNTYASDLRRQFFNMAFLTHAAYDFAADARGYTWGAAAEIYIDAWALRLARGVPPQHPNQLPLDYRFWRVYGDQIELEHSHRLGGRPGAARLLAYRNRELMGRFDDAQAALAADPAHNATTCTGFAYDSANPAAPELCWARRPNIKWGVGLNLEQEVAHGIGAFARGMWSDGQTEVYSYTSTDRSLSLGVLAGGAAWARPSDVAGLAYSQAWISGAHAAFLGAGGVDGFIGDGAITQAREHVVEAFYAVAVLGPCWLSLDAQWVVHPAYNAARGPVYIFGLRLHAEG